eukprot:5532561-Pleurochrysis_carterae.AAC.2
MLEPHHDRVAAYLDHSACSLDVRAKGSRNLEQKWFPAAAMDGFVLGKAHFSTPKSPGLSLNIWVLIERVFDQNLPARAPGGSSGSSSSAAATGTQRSGAAAAAAVAAAAAAAALARG